MPNPDDLIQRPEGMMSGRAVSQLPSRANLYAALAAAQKDAEAVEKDATNTFHKYKYASAEAIIAEARAALSAHGLAVITMCVDRDREARDHVWQGEGNDAWIVTPRRIRAEYLLVHSSGESMVFESTTPVIPEKGRPEDKAEFGSRTENLGYALRDLLLLPRVQEGVVQPSGRDDSRDPGPRPPASQPPRTGPQSAPPAPKNEDAERALRLTKLLTMKAPDGLGWTKQGALGWLKKRFDVDSTSAMTPAQLKDAELLALAKMMGDKPYDEKVAELAAQGRCKADAGAAA